MAFNSMAIPPVKFYQPTIPQTSQPAEKLEPANISAAEDSTPEHEMPKETNNDTNRKAIAIGALAALGAAGITFVAMRHLNSNTLSKIRRECTDAIYQAERQAAERYKALNKQASDMIAESRKRANEAESLQRSAEEKIQTGISEVVDVVRTNAQKELERINAVLNREVGSVDETLLNTMRRQIREYQLDYNPEVPPLKDVSTPYVSPYTKHVEYKGSAQASIRLGGQNTTIPEFSLSRGCDFTIPRTGTVRPSSSQRVDFTPIHEFPTTISLQGDIGWSNDKIARDLLQNFYDGHGQTLDGVRFVVTPQSGGKCRIRIEGEGVYSQDKAILLYETVKAEDMDAAGNYGEGLKMAVLKLLRDKGASEIKMGSDNWRVTWDSSQSKIGASKVLRYSLEKTEQPLKGNYLEFETNDEKLVQSMRNAIGHFYHSGNTDFRGVNFENSLFGIKKLSPNEAGSTYIAGQKFEYQNLDRWDGLNGFTIFFKKKTPKTVFDCSRDRIPIQNKGLENIAKYFSGGEVDTIAGKEIIQTTPEETIRALEALESLWTNREKENASCAVIEGLIAGAREQNVRVKFPDNYLAECYGVSDAIIDDLVSQGYKICHQEFRNIGMPTIKEHVSRTRNHTPIAMTGTEQQKIGIIRAALQKLSQYLEKEFTLSELSPKIYLFDKNAASEAKETGNTLAEAIISDRKSQGFWIDKTHLGTAGFDEAMATTLHELTHKAGGDESQQFSYKLTDVLQRVVEATSDEKNRLFIIEWQNLKKLWGELISG